MYVRGYNGFGSYGGLFDSIKSVVQAVIPAKTIGGKLLSGDVTGAAQSTAKLVTAPTAKPTAIPGALPAGGGLKTPGFFEPGGFVEKNQTALLVAAVGLGLFLFVQKKRR